MSRKTKINVLLPIKMVGELESKARNNTRSSFIESAIRSKLDETDAFSVSEIQTSQLLAMLHHRANDIVKPLLIIVREMMLE